MHILHPSLQLQRLGALAVHQQLLQCAQEGCSRCRQACRSVTRARLRPQRDHSTAAALWLSPAAHRRETRAAAVSFHQLVMHRQHGFSQSRAAKAGPSPNRAWLPVLSIPSLVSRFPHRKGLGGDHALRVQSTLPVHQPPQRLRLDAATGEGVEVLLGTAAAGGCGPVGSESRQAPSNLARSAQWETLSCSQASQRRLAKVKCTAGIAHLMLHSSSASFRSFTVIMPSWSWSSSAAEGTAASRRGVRAGNSHAGCDQAVVPRVQRGCRWAGPSTAGWVSGHPPALQHIQLLPHPTVHNGSQMQA